MTDKHTILVINPGSTSTKLAVMADEDLQASETILHPTRTLADFRDIWEQFPYRLELIRRWIKDHLTTCNAVAGIGGLLRPVSGGTYVVNERMIHDAESNVQGEHASNLGCALAYRLAGELSCPAFVTDPVSVDEFESLAYYSGYPSITRKSLSHAVSLHASARRAAIELGIPYGQSSFVVCHLGGGISISAVRGGRIIDVNDASNDGPFSPERTGSLPLQPVIDMCFSRERTRDEMHLMVMGRGGLVAYLGTNSTKEVERMIGEGNAKAKEVYEAMAYQIAKEIGAMATVLKGNVDAVVITGGAAGSTMLVQWIRERVGAIAQIMVYSDNDEMRELGLGALRILRGDEHAKEY